MDSTHSSLVETVNATITAALEACEALADHERTHEVAVAVAFTHLHRDQVEKWQTRVAEVTAGTRTV